MSVGKNAICEGSPVRRTVSIRPIRTELAAAKISTAASVGIGILPTTPEKATMISSIVGFGVLLSLLLQVNQEAVDLTVVRLERSQDRRLVETDASGHAPEPRGRALDVYGGLMFAGRRTLQARLPDPTAAEQPVVVIRLRGRPTLGATAFIVLADYAERLR